MSNLVLEHQGAQMTIQTVGAEMRGFRTADGVQRLWSGNPEVWKGVAPTLFPNIGAMVNDTVTVEGKPCAMMKHGFARHMEYTPVRMGDSFCTLRLTDTEETLRNYPFHFSLDITHAFTPGGFVTAYLVENRDERAMPFCIGGHPGFTCPIGENERFEDYEIRFETEEEGVSYLCGEHGVLCGTEKVPLGADHRTLKLEYATYDQKDTLVFANLRSRSVELVHRETGRGMRFSFPQFPALAIWTMPGKKAPYVCIEPWIGLPAITGETGRYEDKPFCQTLAKGKSFLAWYEMTVI